MTFVIFFLKIDIPIYDHPRKVQMDFVGTDESFYINFNEIDTIHF